MTYTHYLGFRAIREPGFIALIGGGVAASGYLGICVTAVKDYEPQFPFIDQMRQSRGWLNQDHEGTFTPTSPPPFPALDTNGYPLSMATGIDPTGNQALGTLMLWDSSNTHPTGFYKVYYDGLGQLTFPIGATIITSGIGFYDINVTAGVHMKLWATDPVDHMNNIRVIPQTAIGTYLTGSGIWNPDFYNAVREFGVTRTTTWNEIYNVNTTGWENRIPNTYRTYTENRGVAWEYSIQLANDTNTDLWISIPYKFADDAITQLATLTYNTLNTNLKVWVEYSNEVWNAGFPVYQYAVTEANNRGYAGASDFDKAMKFHGARSVECGNLFENVYGATDRAARVVRVLGHWNASPSNAVVSMNFNDPALYTGAASNYLDTLAIAPYIDPGTGQTEGGTIQGVINNYHSQITGVFNNARSHGTNATARGLTLTCYEAGQHSTATGSIYDFANRDPLMSGVYQSYLNEWFTETTGQYICMFELCAELRVQGGNARWGLLESMGQDPHGNIKAPKWNAVKGWIDTH